MLRDKLPIFPSEILAASKAFALNGQGWRGGFVAEHRLILQGTSAERKMLRDKMSRFHLENLGSRKEIRIETVNIVGTTSPRKAD